MTINEIQRTVEERSWNCQGAESDKVFGAKYISNYEVFDRRAGKQLYLHKSIIELFDRTRHALGRPLTISSGYRSARTQERLVTQWGKAKKSPHTMGCALDIDTENMDEALEIQAALQNASLETGRLPRIGIKKYKGNFVHVDTVFLLFTEFGGELPWPTDYDAIERNWRPGVSW